ncbi:uncharacterized protein LOC144791525 [Lissotriton helveticus]
MKLEQHDMIPHLYLEKIGYGEFTTQASNSTGSVHYFHDCSMQNHKLNRGLLSSQTQRSVWLSSAKKIVCSQCNLCKTYCAPHRLGGCPVVSGIDLKGSLCTLWEFRMKLHLKVLFHLLHFLLHPVNLQCHGRYGNQFFSRMLRF